MGWFSNKIGREDLNHGDHIYTWRIWRGKSYTHHGIYEGDGKVIHLTRGPSSDIGFSSSPSHPSEGPVVCCTLQEFLSGGDLCRYEYGVNALLFLIKPPGTCTCAPSDPPEHVVHRAFFLLNYGFGNYHLLNNNCEDFALYCKTELLGQIIGSRKTGTSGQIASFVAIITTIFAYIIIPYGFLPSRFTGLPLMFCFFYCSIRLHFNAGSLIFLTLQKVPIQKFDQLSYSEPLREEISIKWIPIIVISGLKVSYWTPDNIILVCIRIWFLYVLLSLLLFNYLRSHRFKIFAYIFYHIFALMLWYWTPESTLLQDFRRYFVQRFVNELVIDPLIYYHPKLRKSMTDTVRVFLWWYCTPKSTIFQWCRLFILNDCFCHLVAHLRNDSVESPVYLLNIISASIISGIGLQRLQFFNGLNYLCFMVYTPCFSSIQIFAGSYGTTLIRLWELWEFGLWNWTPEGTILDSIRLCLLLSYPFFSSKSGKLFLCNAVVFGLVTQISRVL